MLLSVRILNVMVLRWTWIAVLAILPRKVLHELHQSIHASHWHGVVEARAHTPDGTMALEIREPNRLRFCDELGVELGPRQRKGHVHPGATVLGNRVAIELRAVDRGVELCGFRAIDFRHRGETALSLQPLEHQAREIPTEGW